MIDLRPMIVVTGTIRIDGGEKNSVRKQPGSTRRTENGNKLVVVHEVVKSDDRNAAEVISTGYARRLQHLRILKTPYGALIDPKNLDRVKEMLTRASTDAVEFNRTHKFSKLSNCYLWERLTGNRLESVRGWIDRQLVDGNAEIKAEIKDALPLLTDTAAA